MHLVKDYNNLTCTTKSASSAAIQRPDHRADNCGLLANRVSVLVVVVGVSLIYQNSNLALRLMEIKYKKSQVEVEG